MATQLTLGITLGSSLRLSSFVEGANAAAVAALTSVPQHPQFIYLWGETGCGKTHLSHALCHLAGEAGISAALLSGKRCEEFSPEMLGGWEHLPLVVLDDIHLLMRDAEWERALFNLFNGLRDTGGSLIVTANIPPAALNAILPDLQSRLGSMLVFHVHALDDDGRLLALQRKARERGMDLPEEAGRWLLARQSRQMHDLAEILDRLDKASLVAQRRLTIPFMREVLEA